MNDFVRQLPWRLGALGGLLVGAISFAGEIELWTCLMRAGIAFFVFSILGLGLRALLESGTSAEAPPHPPAEGGPRTEAGTHVDQTTPSMSASDLPPPDERKSRDS